MYQQTKKIHPCKQKTQFDLVWLSSGVLVKIWKTFSVNIGFWAQSVYGVLGFHLNLTICCRFISFWMFSLLRRQITFNISLIIDTLVCVWVHDLDHNECSFHNNQKEKNGNSNNNECNNNDCRKRLCCLPPMHQSKLLTQQANDSNLIY